ncbi:MAG: M4 family metallopeptidase [Bacteroidia bacterium]
MRSKVTILSAIIILAFNQQMSAQSNTRLAGADVASYSKITSLPNFIKLDQQKIKQDNFVNWAVYSFNLPDNCTFKPYSVEVDQLGFTHTRHQQFVNDIPVEGTMLISHSKDAEVKIVNGDYYQAFSLNTIASLSEDAALQFALKKVNARKYMWENTAFTNQKRIAESDPGLTFYPKGELVMVHKAKSDYSANNMRLAYKFNIYAEKPLYRANVFVDANTGEILDEQNLICTIDVVGTGVTKYSGTVTITSDSTGVGQYRLRETGRGNGIRTFNLQNGTTYQNTDFTNNSSTWNLAGNDQAAADAHWGAEMTYDYYKLVHNRNSINGTGYALNSYVHYDVGYANAFWDGQEMTYGDGAGVFKIMTGLDVCGHEITHGLTNFTAGLGSGEAGALNEGFSDIFGTTIEAFARPSQHDWLMGPEIMTNGQGIRDMSDPKNLGQPNCYLGVNWDPNLEPHQDNGPCIFWYYLLCQGGAATNDNGDAYNVTGITMAKAQMIAFRGLTVYFTPNTTYADARKFTIQAASDIYGPCSPELQATTDAWYAVGVGPQYSTTNVVAGFTTSPVTCAMPLSVNFYNTTSNGASYSWTFGDGTTSTLPSPAHTYTLAGYDTVKLVSTSCAGNKDSINMILEIGAVGINTQVAEGFEVNGLPSAEWDTSSTAGWNWIVNNTAAATGVRSAVLDNSINPAGNKSYFETISHDISTYAIPKLTFKMAYQQKATTNNDKLQVLTSIDCGYSWQQRWAKNGSTLATVTPPSTTPFIPTPSQFTTYTVNINGVAGRHNVRFRFAFLADTASAGPGNNIFIDDINIFDASIGVEDFTSESGLSVYPNPSSGSVTLGVNLEQKQNISVSVTDVLGRVVESVPAKQYAAGENKLTIAEKIKYQPGVYLVNVNMDGKIITRKIIIE